MNTKGGVSPTLIILFTIWCSYKSIGTIMKIGMIWWWYVMCDVKVYHPLLTQRHNNIMTMYLSDYNWLKQKACTQSTYPNCTHIPTHWHSHNIIIIILSFTHLHMLTFQYVYAVTHTHKHIILCTPIITYTHKSYWNVERQKLLVLLKLLACTCT